MPGQITTFRSVAFAALLLLWDVGIGVPARADDCLTAPGSSTPKGSHWHYRTDRAKGQKCWYLRPLGEPAQQPALQDKSAATAHTGAVEKPATKLTPISTEAGGSTPAVPSPKVQPPSISDAPTQEPVGQPTQREGVVSSSPETPTSGASVPWRSITPAPSATAISPDPPSGARGQFSSEQRAPCVGHTYRGHSGISQFQERCSKRRADHSPCQDDDEFFRGDACGNTASRCDWTDIGRPSVSDNHENSRRAWRENCYPTLRA